MSPYPQKSFYNLMTSDKKSERFFKVLHDRMKRAQQETKSTVAVNMNDLGSQPREDREPADPTTKGQRSRQYRMRVPGPGQRMQGEGLVPSNSPSLTRPPPCRPRSFLLDARLPIPLFAGPQPAPGPRGGRARTEQRDGHVRAHHAAHPALSAAAV